ncbi:hypothetical protein GCM10009808_13660 [Microbacterium sediminicola]|uniref:Uncharacterized protein n=1 Tax=Microbacterium sediminicola TaxID=415210 RepID=A0ABN2I2G4_9MICO
MTISKSDFRAGVYVALALILLVAGMFGSYFLLMSPPAGTVWATLVLAALPGAVLTLYIPALRDLKRWIRTIGFVFLAVGIIGGFIVLSSSLADAEAFLPTIVVGSVSLAITAVVAYIDWAPRDTQLHTAGSGTDDDQATHDCLGSAADT